MTGRTYAGRGHRDLARIDLGVGDQLGNGFGHYRGISQHDLRFPDQARDWRDVAQKHEIKLVVERGVVRARGSDDEQRISVGLCGTDSLGSGIYTCPLPLSHNYTHSAP